MLHIDKITSFPWVMPVTANPNFIPRFHLIGAGQSGFNGTFAGLIGGLGGIGGDYAGIQIPLMPNDSIDGQIGVAGARGSNGQAGTDTVITYAGNIKALARGGASPTVASIGTVTHRGGVSNPQVYNSNIFPPFNTGNPVLDAAFQYYWDHGRRTVGPSGCGGGGAAGFRGDGADSGNICVGVIGSTGTGGGGADGLNTGGTLYTNNTPIFHPQSGIRFATPIIPIGAGEGGDSTGTLGTYEGDVGFPNQLIGVGGRSQSTHVAFGDAIGGGGAGTCGSEIQCAQADIPTITVSNGGNGAFESTWAISTAPFLAGPGGGGGGGNGGNSLDYDVFNMFFLPGTPSDCAVGSDGGDALYGGGGGGAGCYDGLYDNSRVNAQAKGGAGGGGLMVVIWEDTIAPTMPKTLIGIPPRYYLFGMNKQRNRRR